MGAIALVASLNAAGDLLAVAAGLGSGDASIGSVAVTVGLIAAFAGGLLAVARLGDGPMMRRRVAIAIGFGVLLAVRLAVASRYDGVSDGEIREYQALSAGVLDGDCCFGDRPMGYPMVLALAIRLLGAGQLPVVALNVLFAVASGALVLSLSRRLYGARVGAVALFLYACWPAGALMVVTTLPHTAYELMILLAAWSALAMAPGWRGSAVIGLVLGLSQYLRPTTSILIPVYLVARLWPGATVRRALIGTLIPMVGTFLLVLLPVVDHNLRTYGDASISTSSFGGLGMYVGTDQQSGGRWSEENYAEVLALPGATLWAKSTEAAELAQARIKADPVGFALLALRKQGTLWGTERYGVQYGIERELADAPARPAATAPLVTSGLFYAVVMAAAAAGVVLLRRRPDGLLLLAVGMIAVLTAAHAFLEVRDRYHSYVVPLLLPLASVAILAALGRVGWLPSRGGMPSDEAAPGDTSFQPGAVASAVHVDAVAARGVPLASGILLASGSGSVRGRARQLMMGNRLSMSDRAAARAPQRWSEAVTGRTTRAAISPEGC